MERLTNMVGIKLSQQTLMKLFRLGVLSAADIQCLDIEDRDIIKKLCLQTCSEKMCAKCEHHNCCSAQQTTIHCALPTSQYTQMH